MYGSWDMVHNGRTGRRKKWHIEVGATVLHLWGFTLLFSVNYSKFGRPQVATDLKSFPFSPALSYFQLYIDSSDAPPPPSFFKGEGGMGGRNLKKF